MPRASGNGRCAGGGGGGGRAAIATCGWATTNVTINAAPGECVQADSCRPRCAAVPLLDTRPRPSTRPEAPSGRCSEPCGAHGWHGGSAIQGWRWAQGGKRACERLAPHSHACSAPDSPRRQIVVAKGRKHACGTAHRVALLAWHSSTLPEGGRTPSPALAAACTWWWVSDQGSWASAPAPSRAQRQLQRSRRLPAPPASLARLPAAVSISELAPQRGSGWQARGASPGCRRKCRTRSFRSRCRGRGVDASRRRSRAAPLAPHSPPPHPAAPVASACAPPAATLTSRTAPSHLPQPANSTARLTSWTTGC